MKNNLSFTSSIGAIIINYLSLKQALGRKYSNEQVTLKQLDEFLNSIKSELNADSFQAWCQSQQRLTSTGRREKMRIIYNFCLYRQRTEPTCFVPDPLQFPKKMQSIQPYIFSKEEIVLLFDAIKELGIGQRLKLRREAIRLALALFYTTGMRLSELSRLTIEDYDSKEHVLLIRESKFHKSRVIPLSKDGWNEIDRYLEIRHHRGLSLSLELPLICSDFGLNKHYSKTAIWNIFRFLFNITNIHTACGNLPRIHDFRHTFAVHALLRWYNENANVQAKLPYLSIYMGHVSIESTQYYLRFIEQVIRTASNLFEIKYSQLAENHNKEIDK